jgi:hypothetical protein
MIYDEEYDRHVHIPFIQALYATCYGVEGGPTGDLFKLADLTDTYSGNLGLKDSTRYGISNWRDAGAKARDKAAADPTSTEAYNAAADVVTLIKNAITAKEWVPVEIVIARPFIEHLMLSAIVAVAGRDTGATLFGPADMRRESGLKLHTAQAVFSCSHGPRVLSQRSPRTPR